MPRATWLQVNFNGGEWSPLAQGRVDIAKYKNGLSECLNFLPTQQGSLTRRTGTLAVSAVKDGSYAPRLIEFEFSITQAYILEFGHHYIRFYTNGGQLLSGGVPYEVATTYTSAEVWDLDFTQSADVLYLAHASHKPAKLERLGATSWVLADISFLDGPYLPVNVTTTTLTPGATSGTTTVVASSVAGINGGVGFQASDVGRLLRLKCGGVWLWGTVATVVNSLNITWTVTVSNGAQLPSAAKALANVSGGSVFGFSITDGGSGYGVQPPNVTITPHVADPATVSLTIVSGVITNASITHAGSGYASTSGTVTLGATGGGSGAAVTWDDDGFGDGAVHNVYVNRGGTGYAGGTTASVNGAGSGGGSGAVGYATVTNGVVTGMTVSVTGTGYTSGADVVLSDPTAIVPSTTAFWRLGVWDSADGYPSVVNFHQDRLFWAGATNSPGRVDGSNTGDYENMGPSNLDGTIVDSNALSFTLNSDSVNAVRWLMSDENGLLIGTAGGEWVIAPSSNQQAITPTNVNAKPLSGYGSANVTPIRIGKATMFVQRTKRKLRELFYQFTYNTFQAPDISLVSEHLTQSGLKQMAVQLAPQQVVWFSRNDGSLVAMTYDKDQDICGWHQHTIGGASDAAGEVSPLVESVACIPSPDTTRDEVWMVVNRYINGATVRYVEVMAKLWENGDDTTHCVFLDSSAEKVPVGLAVSGLTWLEGQTVGVLTDGGTHPDCVVSGGSITLSRTASVAQVGLRYTSRIRTLPIEAGGADGPAQGKLKRVFRTVLRFFQSVGLSAGSDNIGVTTYPEPFRTSADPMGEGPALFDGDRRYSYEGTWDTQGNLLFETSDPLPCNITMIMAQLETSDAE